MRRKAICRYPQNEGSFCRLSAGEALFLGDSSVDVLTMLNSASRAGFCVSLHEMSRGPEVCCLLVPAMEIRALRTGGEVSP